MNAELPKDLLDSERRFYGYSVGKWADDTTLVVETIGRCLKTGCGSIPLGGLSAISFV